MMTLLTQLLPGDTVTLPDGESAFVIRHVRDRVWVIRPENRDWPWPRLFERWQVDERFDLPDEEPTREYPAWLREGL